MIVEDSIKTDSEMKDDNEVKEPKTTNNKFQEKISSSKQSYKKKTFKKVFIYG